MDTSAFPHTLSAFSNEIAATVEQASRAVVAVDGGRWGSSGIVWKPGVAVTADHMLADDDVELTLPDGRTTRGSVQGRDASTDVAVIRFTDDTTLASALHAPMDDVRIGHLSFAVARDDDNDVSASMGIISVLGAAWRTWKGGSIDRFLRADVSLSPRVSRGPLVDSAGRVIGMNTFGLSRRMALTVPASTLERIVDQLLSRGRIPRGFLGIAMQSVGNGSIILSVAPQSPAEHAGLLVGDIIVTAHGTPIEDPDDLQALLGAEAIGNELTLQILRGGEPRNLSLIVGER
jgi:S1-C subfamily serine protease